MKGPNFQDDTRSSLRNSGYTLLHFIAYLGFIGIFSTSLLKSEIYFLKKTNNRIKKEMADISLEHCLSAFLPFTLNAPSLTHIPTYQWHDSKESLSQDVINILKQRSNFQRIDPESAVLESFVIRLPIFHKLTSTDEYKFETPHLSLIKENSQDLFLLLNPWRTVIFQSKSRLKNHGTSAILEIINPLKYLATSGAKFPYYDLKKDLIKNSSYLAPLDSYGLIYLSTNQTLEYFSLSSNDRQPICRKLTTFKRSKDLCHFQINHLNYNAKSSIDCPNPSSHPADRQESLSRWQ